MTDYAALQVKISDLKYVGMSDEDLAVAINAETISTAVDVRAGDVRGYALRQGLLFACKQMAGNITALNALRAAADSFVSLCDPAAAAEMIPMADPQKAKQIAGMLVGLVEGGAISKENAADLLAMAVENIPWPRANGFGRDLDYNDCVIARAS